MQPGYACSPDMHEALVQLQREIGESLSGLDAAQTQLRPAKDSSKWSIQQVVEHLLLTYRSSCSVFETRIAKGTPTRAQPSMEQRAGQFLVLKAGYMPKGRKAPAGVVPPAFPVVLRGAALTEQTAALLAQFDGLAAEAEGLFGHRRSISHQVLGPLSVAQWRRFQLIHGQHHLKQIRAIRSASGC